MFLFSWLHFVIRIIFIKTQSPPFVALERNNCSLFLHEELMLYPPKLRKNNSLMITYLSDLGQVNPGIDMPFWNSGSPLSAVSPDFVGNLSHYSRGGGSRNHLCKAPLAWIPHVSFLTNLEWAQMMHFIMNIYLTHILLQWFNTI